MGLHPFGRFPGVSGIDMGAIAIRRALADAGVEWRQIEFAFGGSYEVDNPDAVVALLGLTGIPFTDVYNGCATAASALALAAQTIRLGESGLGIAVGMDKHLPGAFSADPRLYACPSWYGEVGQFITTKFFAMKINRYMHDYGITHDTLAKVAAKNFRNGAEPERLPPQAVQRGGDPRVAPMLNYPLTQYMFCSPDEGAAAVVLCRAERAREFTDTPIYLRSVVRTRRSGSFEVYAPWLSIERGRRSDGRRRQGVLRARRHRPRETSTSSSSRTARRAPRSSTWPRTASAPTASRRRSSPTGATEIGGSLPVNTDGGLIANGEPIGASGLRQVPRSRAPAPRPRRRPPGAGQPEGRLHPALRRARRAGVSILS